MTYNAAPTVIKASNPTVMQTALKDTPYQDAIILGVKANMPTDDGNPSK